MKVAAYSEHNNSSDRIFRKSQFNGAWLVAGSPGVPLLGEWRRGGSQESFREFSHT